ncbi:MAG: hypothetical protein GY798_02555 [Hyphomicrobiales bacterium]|nr:hypothetical protein [Hyphomicrobiales bacterium]
MATVLEQALDWGTAVSAPEKVVKYYLYEDDETTPFGDPSRGWTAGEEARVRDAFDTYEAFLDLQFEQAGDPNEADFHLVTYSAGSVLGRMSPPGEPKPGLGEFNVSGTGWDNGLKQGGYGFVTIIHEFGHGLGLAHPHDYGGTSGLFPGVTSPWNSYGSHDLNQGVYTTMSYNDSWETNPDGESPSLKYGHQGTPMALDIAVLQAKYGANNSFETGNNTYALPTANEVGTFYIAIWDAGGIDEIVHAGNRMARIDLRAATLEVEPGGGGFLSYADGIHGGFTIANGVVIENATGGDNDDFLSGNSTANFLVGGEGKDTVQGRGGSDTIAGKSGKDKLVGGAGDDDIGGGKGNDILKGKSGSDILNGGRGSDELIGGDDSDTFVFSHKLDSAKADTITDFVPGLDAIEISLSVFKKVGSVGELAAAAFHIGAKAKTSDHRIIYNDQNGKLKYDKNGDDSGGAKKFAIVDAGLSISHEDFVIVA